MQRSYPYYKIHGRSITDMIILPSYRILMAGFIAILAPSSSGPGHQVLILKIAGSNPAGVTKSIYLC
jgi:hypothetical protein